MSFLKFKSNNSISKIKRKKWFLKTWEEFYHLIKEKTAIKIPNFQIKAKKTSNSCLSQNNHQLSNIGHFKFHILLTRSFKSSE